MCEVAELIINTDIVDLLPVLQIKENDYIALLEKIKNQKLKLMLWKIDPKQVQLS